MRNVDSIKKREKEEIEKNEKIKNNFKNVLQNFRRKYLFTK